MVDQTPISTTGPYHHKASKFDPFRRDTPVPNCSTGPTPEPQQPQYSQQPTPIARQPVASARTSPLDWTPLEVVEWMQSLGFDDDTMTKFFTNDISGSILLELEPKEIEHDLHITSFGKRHRLINSIKSLKINGAFNSTETISSRSRNSSVSSGLVSTQNTASTSLMSGNGSSYRSSSCYATDEESRNAKPRTRHRSQDSTVRTKRDLLPGDSVSIVAIEQVLPKLHQCSKGEACRKWQKQQDKLARLAQDLPFEHFGSGRIVAGDPGNPQTAPNLLKSPKTDVTPSLVASSDIMGPGKSSAVHLSQEKLNEVKPRDPQENVRNFLNFQSLDRLQTVNQPRTPPEEFGLSPEPEVFDSAKITPTLAEHLRHLPKLRIPSMRDSSDGSVFTENTSALRTITPSILSRRNHFNDRAAVIGQEQLNPHDIAASPADFYRVDPCYRSETPFSDVDVDAPVTAVPTGPVAREESQSVPPNMRFGNRRLTMEDLIMRPASTKAEESWRYPSIQNIAPMNPLKEGAVMTPIETPEDLHKTPRAPQVRNNTLVPFTRRGQDDITHSGWMKKRKTTKLLCHDWEDHHFTLKGTQLSMHDSDISSHHNSKALEHIDVDDYAVACSSFASKSKLTAAFRKTILKRGDNPSDTSAFSFSLIPTPYGSGFVDRKTMFLNSGKSHHFAVKTRDERIDWMRELMLAKALKRGRDSGAELTFNGANMI